jgi:hypothetical protein
MIECERVRPLLAELLTGALEPTEAGRCLAHVESCPECGERLAELESLEESLTRLGPIKPASASTARVVLVLVLVLVVFFVWFQKLRSSAPRPKPGNASPRDLAGATIDPGPGAAFAVPGPREVRLDSGEVAFRVLRRVTPFRVETPRGSLLTEESAFAVLVENGGFSVDLSRNKLATAAVVTVVVGTGAVLWKSVDGAAEAKLAAGDRAEIGPAGLRIERPSELAEAAAVHSAQVEKLERTNAELKAALAAAQAKTAELERKLAATTAPETSTTAPKTDAVAAAPAGGGTGPSATAGPKPRRIVFAATRDMPELAKVDWREAGDASRKIDALLRGEVGECIKAGKSVPPELGAKIAALNQKLVNVAVAILGKLGTNLPNGNGEYTHPVVLANLEAEHLELAGVPLSDDQVSSILSIGNDYDAQWSALQAGYAADTLRLDKVLDELALKKSFCDRMDAVLTPEQRAQLFDPETRHVLQLDLYSPMLMVTQLCAAIGKAAVPDIQKAIVSGWFASLDLEDEAKRPDLQIAAASLVGSCTPPVVSPGMVPFVGYDEALAAGRANVRVLKDLVRTLGDDAKDAIQKTATFYVPRIVKKDAPPK